MPGEHADDPAAARARRELRRHYAGTLVFDAGVCHVRYVLDGRLRLLFPVEPAAAALAEATLFVPEERDGALQVHLGLTAADAHAPQTGALTDRWQAYHAGCARTGSPGAHTRWLWGTIEGTKMDGDVVSGDEIAGAGPDPGALRPIEPRLCRQLADRAALARACRALAGVEADNPVAVGVDPEGIDVRARFGIVRLEFDAPAPDEAAVRERIAALLSPGGAA